MSYIDHMIDIKKKAKEIIDAASSTEEAEQKLKEISITAPSVVFTKVDGSDEVIKTGMASYFGNAFVF